MNDRQQKTESILRELAAGFVLAEANTNPLITITRAAVSTDGHKATIFFTTIPEEREQDALIFMKRTGSDLRDYIKQHGRFKSIPHLDFSIDGEERTRQHEEVTIAE